MGAGISGNQRRFTSYDRSTTTKLDYAVNRTYNAGLGRFTQVDPIGMGAVYIGNPQSLNLYAYCFNDPINHTDPDGLDGGVTFVVIQVVSAVIGLFRAIFGGGKLARTAPIIKQITHRRQGQLTQRTIWTQAGIQAGVGAVSAFMQAPSRKVLLERQSPKANPCPPDKRRFFDWLVGPLAKLAQELDTTKELLLTQAVKEAGWDKKGLDHNMPLNNPFGVNRIKNRKAVGNRKYGSLDEAIQDWKRMYGDRVRGTKNTDDYLNGIFNLPGGAKYNSENPQYKDEFKARYEDVLRYMKRCGIT